MTLDTGTLPKIESYYRGCEAANKPGHYLFQTINNRLIPVGSSDCLPWKWDDIDVRAMERSGQLENFVQPPDQIYMRYRDGWTAMGFWDRTGDHRGGSNSVFLAKGTYSPEEMWQIAEHHFPGVHARVTKHLPANARTVNIMEGSAPPVEVNPVKPAPKPSTTTPEASELTTTPPNGAVKEEAQALSHEVPKLPVNASILEGERRWYEFFTHTNSGEFSAVRAGITGAVIAGIAALGYVMTRPKDKTTESWQARTATPLLPTSHLR